MAAEPNRLARYTGRTEAGGTVHLSCPETYDLWTVRQYDENVAETEIFDWDNHQTQHLFTRFSEAAAFFNTLAIDRTLEAGRPAAPHALCLAAQDGTAEEIREIFADNPDLDVNGRDADGDTLLHWAVAVGNTGTITALIDAGADLAAQDSGGRTAREIARDRGTEALEAFDALVEAVAGTEDPEAIQTENAQDAPEDWLEAVQVRFNPETGDEIVTPVEMRWDAPQESFVLRPRGEDGGPPGATVLYGIGTDSEKPISALMNGADGLVMIAYPQRTAAGQVPDETGYCSPFSTEGWCTMRTILADPDIPTPLKQELLPWCVEVTRLHDCIQEHLQKHEGSVVKAGIDPAIATVSLTRVISEEIGPCELPPNITYDDLMRFALKDSLERQLRMLPGHAPDRGTLTGDDVAVWVADGIGVQPRDDIPAAFGSGAYFRAGVLAAAAAGDEIARINDNLVRMVFEPLTRTPPEEFTVARFPGPNRHAEIITALQDKAEQLDLEGDGPVETTHNPWINAVTARLGQAMGGSYLPDEIALWRLGGAGGTDALVVSDHAGTAIYCWPTEDRRNLFEIDDGQHPVPMITPRQIPSVDEIAHLTARLQAALTPSEIVVPPDLQRDAPAAEPGP